MWPDGHFIDYFPKDKNKLLKPLAIAYDAERGRFYITDRLNNRIEIWGY